MSNTTVGEFIKTSRENLDISQEALTKRVTFLFGKNKTLSRGHLSNIEIGASGVSVTKMNALTKALMTFGAE
jgi:transcriptional regulator with XRE-family HTH domain